MRLRILILAGAMACSASTFSLSARAADEHVPPPDLDAALAQLLAPEAWLGGRITETDIELLFAYLRASLLGATNGYEVPIPEELKRRTENLGRELRMHGILTGLVLLQALEARAKRVLPTPYPSYPPSHRRL